MAEDTERQFKRESELLELLDSQINKSVQAEMLDDLEEEREKIKDRTAITLLELGSHTLILGLTLGSIYLIHLILEGLLGHDAKFFNWIPIRWIIDIADLLVIGKFLWEIIKDFRDVR